MRIRKSGGAIGSPRFFHGSRPRLEGDPEAKLQLSHLAVAFQAVDNAGPGAVNAGVTGQVIDGMVEHVEELRLELSLDVLSNREVLKDGHVGHELARTRKLVAVDVTESRNLGTREWSADSAVSGKRGHRGKIDDLPGLIVEAAGTLVEATGEVGTARPGISV